MPTTPIEPWTRLGQSPPGWSIPSWQLPLAQLSDSALPTGAFSHSFGLETYVNDGSVTDAGSFTAWLSAFVRHQLAPTDGLAIRLAHEALDRDDSAAVWALDELLTAQALPRQVREAARTMGRRMLSIARTIVPGSRPLADYAEQVELGACAAHPALAFALAAHAVGAPAPVAVAAYLQSCVISLTQNAVRAVPLGQDAGQRALARLGPVVDDAVAAVEVSDPLDLGATPPGLEIAQLRHERQRARMFMS